MVGDDHVLTAQHDVQEVAVLVDELLHVGHVVVPHVDTKDLRLVRQAIVKLLEGRKRRFLFARMDSLTVPLPPPQGPAGLSPPTGSLATGSLESVNADQCHGSKVA